MNFSMEKIIAFVKNYKVWIIFILILFFIYLIVKSPRIYSSFEVELDRVDTLKLDLISTEDTVFILN